MKITELGVQLKKNIKYNERKDLPIRQRLTSHFLKVLVSTIYFIAANVIHLTVKEMTIHLDLLPCLIV